MAMIIELSKHNLIQFSWNSIQAWNDIQQKNWIFFGRAFDIDVYCLKTELYDWIIQHDSSLWTQYIISNDQNRVKSGLYFFSFSEQLLSLFLLRWA